MIRQYLSPIALSVGASLLFILLSVVPYAIYNYREHGQIPVKRTLIGYSFIWYLVAAYFLVILPLPTREAVAQLTRAQANLEPFIFVEHFLRYSGIELSDPGTYFSALLQPTAYTVYFNLLLTVPLGIYLRKYFGFGFFKTLGIGFLLSLFFEITQLTGLYGVYPRPYRIFNVDDLIINSLGAAIGFWLAPLLKGWTPEMEKEDRLKAITEVSIPRRLLALSMDIALIAGIYPVLLTVLEFVFVQEFGDGSLGITILFLLSFTYFMTTALVLGNQTLGMAVVRIHVRDENDKGVSRWRMLFRHGLFLLWIPGSLVFLEITSLEEPLISFTYLAVFVVIGTGLLHMLISVLRRNRRLFHERMSKTHLKSLSGLHKPIHEETEEI